MSVEQKLIAYLLLYTWTKSQIIFWHRINIYLKPFWLQANPYNKERQDYNMNNVSCIRAYKM